MLRPKGVGCLYKWGELRLHVLRIFNLRVHLPRQQSIFKKHL